MRIGELRLEEFDREKLDQDKLDQDKVDQEKVDQQRWEAARLSNLFAKGTMTGSPQEKSMPLGSLATIFTALPNVDRFSR